MVKQIKSFFPLAFAAVLGSAISLGAYKYFEGEDKAIHLKEATPTAYTQYIDNNKNTPNIPADFSFAAEKATPGVVHIRSTIEAGITSSSRRMEIPEQFRDFFGDDFFGGGPRGKQQATGSGVIISDDGYIVTNNHVVDEADNVEVTLYDKRSYKGKIIGTDPNTDLALIKIEEKNLPHLALANSDDAKVGQWVLAVGNPFNLTSTVTAGIISAKGRNINILQRKENDKNSAPIESFIQTDAAVNPGNSGGALINLNGDLIGINTAIASSTGQFAGYSFAVPASIVRKVVDDLSKFGTVQRGYLGININDVNSEIVKEKNLKVYSGIYISGFSENSAAKDAGIKEGDVIVQIDGLKVRSVPELQEQIARHRPGDKVKILINRAGLEKEVIITLKNRDGSVDVIKKEKTEANNSLGADFSDLSDMDKKQYKLDGGVRVNKVYSGGKIREFTDMKEGFIINKVDDTNVRSVKDLNQLLASKKGGVMLKGTYPGSTKTYIYGVDY